MRRMLLRVAVLGLVPVWPALVAAAPFHYEVDEGRNLNYFLREGQSAAHLVLSSGQDLRLLVAFPAGNSGVGLWFQHQAAQARWTLDAPPVAAQETDEQGRALHGIVFETSLAAKSLVIKQAVLSSVRVLRDYQTSRTAPGEVLVPPAAGAGSLNWSRARLDGAPGYRLTLKVLDGVLSGETRIAAGADGRIKLRVTALSGETPLTPLAGTALFNGTEEPDDRARQTLTFLSYQEKLLAGSWRFNTYFGRDTLISLRLLMPVLTAPAIEAGLDSVLSRLAPDGEVAHEEGIGEFAVLAHRAEAGGPGAAASDAALLDYAMIDGNYLLAPVLASYLLDSPQGRQRGAAYLQQAVMATADAMPAGQALLRNLRLVVGSAAGFAAAPRYDHLIALKAGHTTGEWRDSRDGLGDGRYPYDVNGILMPAALEATGRLLASGLLVPYMTAGDRERLASAAAYGEVWRRSAPPLFEVSIGNTGARAAVTSYARQLRVSAADALAALAAMRGGSIKFHAVSLDASGRPVPVLSSDEGFALLLTDPSPAALDEALTSVMRPFPLGLLTDAGLVVANPVFADAATRARFTQHAYHGTVVWSWQQALLASGLTRQMARAGLPDPVKQHLGQAQKELWRVIRDTRSMEASELWTWQYKGGHYRIVPFGASSGDSDESNAAQLWSSVYLAVKPPAGLPAE